MGASLRPYNSDAFYKNVLVDKVGGKTLGTLDTGLSQINIISWADFKTDVSNNGYHTIPSSFSGVNNSTHRFFTLKVEIEPISSTSSTPIFNTVYDTMWGNLAVPTDSDAVNPVITAPENSIYNKYEQYITTNRSNFNTGFFKIPDLINRFVRGGETNIGDYYEDTIKNHTHESMGHSHDFQFNDTIPHQHSNVANFNGDDVIGHRHKFVVNTIDVSFETIKTDASATTQENLGKLLVHPLSNDRKH